MERMVPVQQLADVEDDLVRLAAAKDAEIAALKAERDDARAVIADLYDEIATLTERRDEAIAHSDNDRSRAKAYREGRDRATEQRDRAIAERNETRDRTYETIRQLREQRDRAMKDAVIAWSVCASLHREFCKGRDPFYATRQADFLKHEADARAALDTESAAETAPSLPETPE